MKHLLTPYDSNVNMMIQSHQQPQQQRPQAVLSISMLRRRKQNKIITWMTDFLLLAIICIIRQQSDDSPPLRIFWIQAYPTGAGSCPGGVPAVGGPHILTNTTDDSSSSATKLIQSSSLLDNEFLVAINDSFVTTAIALNPTFYINTPNTISVYNNRFLYKGILIRVEIPTTDTTTTAGQSNFTFVPLTNTQSSFACLQQGPNVIGITHTNSTFKNVHSGILEILVPTSNVTLDITVVGVNNDTISLYAYDRVYINFIDPNATIVETTDRPTSSPVGSDTTPTETTPTTTPSNDTDIIAQPTSMKLRKNLNVSMDNDNEDANKEYTFYGENIQVQLSYILSSFLTDGEIRAYERITSTWYDDFYNTNFYTAYNSTTNRTDIVVVDVVVPETDTTTTSSVEDNTVRKLQTTEDAWSLNNNYGIVLGSMMTSINVTNVTYSSLDADNDRGSNDTGNATMKTKIVITYSQRITYRSSINAVSGSGSKPIRNMQQQYLTIPYRSRIGRQLYTESLVESNIYTFSQLSSGDITSTDTLSVPVLVGPPPQTMTASTTTKEEKEKFAKGYIAVITIGGLTVIAALIIMYQNNKYRLSSSKVTTDEEVSASVLLAEQRQHYADDTGNDSDISGVTGNRLTDGVDNREYIIYAPAGRLGIVLDDHTVLSNASKKNLTHFGPVISMIKEGSPLINDSNMNVGDMIVAIDDIDVRNMTPQKVSKFINDRSKHPIRKITCIQIPNMIQNVNVSE